MNDRQFRLSCFEHKEINMNWNYIEANWKQFKAKVLGKPANDQQDRAADKQVVSTAMINKSSTKNDCMLTEELQSRRAVLRGALAIGCYLFAPTALISAQAVAADSAAPTAGKKVSKASVKYQNSAKGEEKCSGCINFIAESNTCKRVEGKINPNGHCILWAKKG
jgi:hypothetical protein